jgi:uncharacterized protein (DUF1697 family)
MKTKPGSYVSFIRGINVGGNSIIKMDDLKKSFSSMGFSNVKTILASGNVVFETPEQNLITISENIAGKLEKMIGRKVSVMVRSINDIKEMEEREPFKEIEKTPGTRAFITFIPDYNTAMNMSKPETHEDYSILEVYNGMIASIIHEKPGIGTLDLMGGIEKRYGKNVTTRTWGTIQKVLKAIG